MRTTIIGMMRSIYEKMQHKEQENEQYRWHCTKMPIANMKIAANEIDELGILLNLSNMQVVLLIAIVQKATRRRIDPEDVCAFLDVDYLDFLEYNDDLEELRRKNYISIDDDGDIRLLKSALISLKQNKPVEPEVFSNLSTGIIITRIKRHLRMLQDKRHNNDEFCEVVRNILLANPETSITRVFQNITDAINFVLKV